MIMPAIGGIARRFALIAIVERNTAVIVMMMVRINAHLHHTMLSLMHRPSRSRHAHAEREPNKHDQTEQKTDNLGHAETVGIGTAAINRLLDEKSPSPPAPAPPVAMRRDVVTPWTTAHPSRKAPTS